MCTWSLYRKTEDPKKQLGPRAYIPFFLFLIKKTINLWRNDKTKEKSLTF